LNRRRQPFQTAVISVYNDLTGLRWLRKYFKGRQRHTYLGLESWAGPGIAVYLWFHKSLDVKFQRPPLFSRLWPNLHSLPLLSLVKTSCRCRMNDLDTGFDAARFDKILAMVLAIITSLRHLLGWAVSAFRSRQDLILENLALRQQLLALHAKRPRRRMTILHKLFWVLLQRLWSEWERPLILVTPKP